MPLPRSLSVEETEFLAKTFTPESKALSQSEVAHAGQSSHVCRAALARIMAIGPSGGNGSGVLLSRNGRPLIATSSSVWNTPESARESRVFLDYENGSCPFEVALEPDRLFVLDEQLGFVLVACCEDRLDGREPVQLLPGHVIVSGSSVQFWEHEEDGHKRLVNQVVREVAEDHMLCSSEKLETVGAPGFQEANGAMRFVALQCSYRSTEGLSRSIFADHIIFSANVRIPLAEMVAQKTNASVQAKQCRLLGKLAYENDRNKVSIVNANGVEHICMAMAAHLNSELVQEEGCGALINIATGRVDVQAAIVSAGGIRLICAALKAHEKSEIVQGSGCWALACIAADSKTGVHTHIAEVGGIERICNAMKQHKQNAAVQVAACRAVANLSATNDPDIQESITMAGAIDHICGAMQAHLNSAVVQKRACSALMHIAASSVDAQALIARSGGIERICTAMAVHSQSPDVQEKGCWALVCLTGDSSTGNHVSIVKAGGIERICAAMASHESCSKVQEVGLQCIARLSLLHRPGSLDGKVVTIEGLRDNGLEHVAECGKCVIS